MSSRYSPLRKFTDLLWKFCQNLWQSRSQLAASSHVPLPTLDQSEPNAKQEMAADILNLTPESTILPSPPKTKELDLDAVKQKIVGFIHSQSKQMESVSENVSLLKGKQTLSQEEMRSEQVHLQKSFKVSDQALVELQVFADLFVRLDAVRSSIDTWVELEKSVHESLLQIDSIAFNSKILAFNASLEASRAGVEGRGFLVVADKMREFSEEIVTIAKSIRGKINHSCQISLEVTESFGNTMLEFNSRRQQIMSSMEAIHQSIGDIKGNLEAKLELKQKEILELTTLEEQIAKTVERSSSSAADLISYLQDSQIDQMEPSVAFAQLANFDSIIDVRRADEYQAELGHIEGSILLTIDENFGEKLANLDKSLKYLFVCRSGGRSARASRIAADQNFIHVTNMVGGMLKWNELQLPVVKKHQTDSRQSGGELSSALARHA